MFAKILTVLALLAVAFAAPKAEPKADPKAQFLYPAAGAAYVPYSRSAYVPSVYPGQALAYSALPNVGYNAAATYPTAYSAAYPATYPTTYSGYSNFVAHRVASPYLANYVNGANQYVVVA